ncbi:MarR family winged helix-turn-helix transcriptional regulator [Kouleothrix sp.]|uniref:MarR family winged helix-turn-helix transcriptional regulator n=1 Tax=Kouleothrix sp. TaxID=2779161 RepID=UPI00391B4452
MIRELTWHGQKHAIQTLTRPEIGLTMPQMVTLLAIYDSGSCRMGDLADATQQSGGTLTGIVDRLIVDGLVERVRSAQDRRVIEVVLTPAGKARVQGVLSARQADLERILSGFTDRQLEQFEQLLMQFLHGLHGVAESPEEPARELGA